MQLKRDSQNKNIPFPEKIKLCISTTIQSLMYKVHVSGKGGGEKILGSELFWGRISGFGQKLLFFGSKLIKINTKHISTAYFNEIMSIFVLKTYISFLITCL